MFARVLLILLFIASVWAQGMNFDFVDARKKGYSDKEILDYVAKHLNGYDVAAARSAGLSDKEIVDFFIQRDSVNAQIAEAQRNAFKDVEPNNVKVYPKEISSSIALGCMVYTGKIKQNDGWSYVSKLTDFAIAAYTAAYLTQADYFDIKTAKSVRLRDICAANLNNLTSQDEINKFYALSLVKEINNIVKQKKSLTLN